MMNCVLKRTITVVCLLVFCCVVSGHLLDMSQTDTMAVQTRLEDEKAKRLLLQNDLEELMLKVAQLERNFGGTDIDGSPMVLALKVAENDKKLDKTRTEIERLRTIVTARYGSVYVRWGRTNCPDNHSELVYKGFTAGSHYTNTGAAAELICLPEDPTWDHFTPGVQDAASHLYGAEYKFDARNRVEYFGREIHDHDVPCVVCRLPRSTILMVPGRTACYDSWSLEYRGYLAAGHHSHASASHFVCIDNEAEVVSGGSGSDNGYLFYFVEPRCGSLKCPPYVEGQELSCVVCSK